MYLTKQHNLTEQQKDVMQTIVNFLIENEQFGDDWSDEIECLNSLIESDNQVVSKLKIKKAEQVLIDNGIEQDEAENVLQAIGYVLLDMELYQE